MKILQLISSSGIYGAEAVVLNLSRSLNASGHHSTIGVFAHVPSPLPQLHEAALGAGIATEAIRCQGQVDLSVLDTIRKLVQTSGADIVHAHGYKADIYAYLALRKTRSTLVSTCHTWHDADLRTQVYGAIDRQVLRRYNGVTAVSAEVQSRLLQAGIREERIRYIPNGIDLQRFSPKPLGFDKAGRPPVVGLACRLAHEKGVDIFARTAASILATLPATRFAIAGDGPERESLENLIRGLGIGNSVDLLGRIDDMAGFYQSVDLLISSSRSEGMPMTLLEAMASGLPIVATAVGDVPRVVRDGHTGILTSLDPHALAQAAIRLLCEPSLREQYGNAGRELVAQEFSAQRMMLDYLDFYRSVSKVNANKQRDSQ